GRVPDRAGSERLSHDSAGRIALGADRGRAGAAGAGMSRGLTLSVLMEHELVTFTRAVGALRRRNFPIKSIAVGPSACPGLARLTIMMETDQATADRAARQLEKIIGVREVTAFPASAGVARELALVKVRAGHVRYAELLDIALLYKATILD